MVGAHAMPVKVLLADDAEIVRKAIRKLLADSPELVVLVGEAVNFPQTIQMTNDLKPQVIVLDLHIARHFESSEVKSYLSKTKMLAISLSNDDEARALAKSYGALLLLDKMNLFDELVPAIIKTAFPAEFAATN